MDPGNGEFHFAAVQPGTTLGAGGINPQDLPGLVGEKTGIIDATYSDIEVGEFEDELRDRDGLVLYRKILTDASVRQGLNYRQDAMRNTNFRIMPGSRTDPVMREQAAFVADQLGLNDLKAGKYGFNRLIGLHEMAQVYRRAFGELVFAPGADGKFVMDKLTPMHPLTIDSIEYDNKGGFKNVVQKGKIRGEGGAQVEKKIPIWKTVMFTNQDDGISGGESILRPVIVHWRVKRALMVLMNQGIERYALGVPILTVPETVKPDSKEWTAARMVCINYVTQPRMGVVVPAGWTFEILKMQGAMPEIIPYLEYHDQAIMRALGVEFTTLGMKEGTSVPVAAQMSMTAQSVAAMVQEFCSNINLYVIPKIVLLNWPDATVFPRIVADTESAGELSAAANLFGMLMNGAIDLVVADQQAELQARAAELQASAAASTPSAGTSSAGTGAAGKAGSVSGGASRSGTGKTPSAKFGLEDAAGKIAESADPVGTAQKVALAVDALKGTLPTRLKRLLGVLEDEHSSQLDEFRQSAQTVRTVDGRKPVP